MSWGRVESPKKCFKTGQTVKSFIKEINGNKIALSLKFAETNPWKDAEIRYAVGTEVTGKVARMTDFGAFIELEPGVDALLHVSQIAREHVEKPSDSLKVGGKVTAKVVDMNQADRKISLSVKALLAPEGEDETIVPENAAAVPEDAAVVSEEQATVPEDVAVVSEDEAAVPEDEAVVSEDEAAVPEEQGDGADNEDVDSDQ
jgi:ribosomal protein S1